MKRAVACEALLAHPDFAEPFEICAGASDRQMGAATTQQGRPIVCCSRKLTAPWSNCTVAECELLAAAEALKEFRNVLLGQQTVICTDHKNLAHEVCNTLRMMRWHLLIEEHGPGSEHAKGAHNTVADALSRLDLLPALRTEADPAVLEEPLSRPLAKAFAFAPSENDRVVSVCCKILMREQRADPHVEKLAQTAACSLRAFHGGETKRWQLCTVDDKILVPVSLQERMVEWRHENVRRPGEDHTEGATAQRFAWKGMRRAVRRICSACDACQCAKQKKKKCGKPPPKTAEVAPWDALCADMIGPHEMSRRGKLDLQSWVVAAIDPATGWLEIAEAPGAERADVAASLAEQQWSTRCPWPDKTAMD